MIMKKRPGTSEYIIVEHEQECPNCGKGFCSSELFAYIKCPHCNWVFWVE